MCTAGPALWCPSSWKLYFDVFFGFLSSPRRTQVTTVWSLGDDGATNHRCQHHYCHQLQTAVTWVLDKLERNQKIGSEKKCPFYKGGEQKLLGQCPYGSVSAGREKWPFNVLFFLKVEPLCDQTWWDSLVFSILSCFSYVVDAENTLVGPVGPF